MSSLVKICICPFEPSIASAEGLTISVSPPYSDTEVTVTINPNVLDYIEEQVQGDLQIAQSTELHTTDETLTTKFNIQSHPDQQFAYGGRNYNIKFMGTTKESHAGQEFTAFSFFIEELELSDVMQEGSFVFTLNHEHADWITNDSGYRFKPVGGEGLFIQVVKNHDKTLKLSVNGALGHSLTFRQDISNITTPDLHVTLTWGDAVIKLYLNAQQVQELTVN